MGTGEKLLFLYELPLDLIRDISIPPCDETQWNKKKVMIQCFLTPITFLFLNDSNQTQFNPSDRHLSFPFWRRNLPRVHHPFLQPNTINTSLEIHSHLPGPILDNSILSFRLRNGGCVAFLIRLNCG